MQHKLKPGIKYVRKRPNVSDSRYFREVRVFISNLPAVVLYKSSQPFIILENGNITKGLIRSFRLKVMSNVCLRTGSARSAASSPRRINAQLTGKIVDVFPSHLLPGFFKSN